MILLFILVIYLYVNFLHSDNLNRKKKNTPIRCYSPRMAARGNRIDESSAELPRDILKRFIVKTKSHIFIFQLNLENQTQSTEPNANLT